MFSLYYFVSSLSANIIHTAHPIQPTDQPTMRDLHWNDPLEGLKFIHNPPQCSYIPSSVSLSLSASAPEIQYLYRLNQPQLVLTSGPIPFHAHPWRNALPMSIMKYYCIISTAPHIVSSLVYTYSFLSNCCNLIPSPFSSFPPSWRSFLEAALLVRFLRIPFLSAVEDKTSGAGAATRDHRSQKHTKGEPRRTAAE